MKKRKVNKKVNKKFITKTILIILLIIFILFFILIFILNKNINIKLNGKEKETIEVYSEYTDPGYNATIFKSNINDSIITNNNIDTTKLGKYYITYELPYLHTHLTKREISVVDSTKPTITLNGSDTINIYIFEEYKDEGVTITDNYDKDLSSNLIISNNLNNTQAGTYEITYTVHDSSNNISTIKRTINVKPKIYNNCTISNKIEEYICKNNYDVSIGYYNLTNENTYYYKPNKTYYGASLIKTLDALYLYDKNLINDNLKEYVKKAITVSDNPSHHYLVNHIGFNNLKQYGKSIGASNTLIGGDNFGITSVNDQLAVMKKLYEITKDNQNEELKSFFLNTRKNYLIFDNSPTIMHKYGHCEYVYHNSGIVLDTNPYIVTILTNEGHSDHKTIISTLSKLIYEYHQTN